ncbi:MBL fold metallo-hydrolase [Streptomyces tendae]|uniref:MBL fold metallo-hydrolase n=1 Tax=Streptomyces tendae TaxID=1932 RepID=UPI00378D9FBA
MFTSRISPAFLGWDLGGIVVRRVDEIDMSPATSQWLLPDATPEHLHHPWLQPDFTDGTTFAMHVHIFAIEVNGKRILVDTGIGNDKPRQIPDADNLQTPLLAWLTAAGFAPDTVDLVITTHMHIDHVGWNTHLVDSRWTPTFPNARYLTDRREWDYWTAAAESDEEVAQVHRDSLRPIRDNGLYDLLDIPASGHEVADGVRLVPTRGHTPGHLSVKLTGTGGNALISGDSLHHPVQLAYPNMGSVGDVDPAEARITRYRLLTELAGTDDLLLGTHFTHPTSGRVQQQDNRFQLLDASLTLLPPASF